MSQYCDTVGEISEIRYASCTDAGDISGSKARSYASCTDPQTNLVFVFGWPNLVALVQSFTHEAPEERKPFFLFSFDRSRFRTTVHCSGQSFERHGAK